MPSHAYQRRSVKTKDLNEMQSPHNTQNVHVSVKNHSCQRSGKSQPKGENVNTEMTDVRVIDKDLKAAVGSSCCGAAETNPTRNHEVSGKTPGPVQWVKDPVLLWLWCGLAAGVPIRPLSWEPPYAMGVSLKS